MKRSLILLLVLATPWAFARPSPVKAEDASVLFVDPAHGKDEWAGTERKPLRSISAALARIAEPVEEDHVIELAPGRYESTGGTGMPEKSLQLSKRMRPDVRVTLRAAGGAPGGAASADRPVLAWKGERRTIEACEGRWSLEGLQIGSFEEDQVRGLYAHGPVEVLCRDVVFELRSRSDAALWSERGARLVLTGAIRINDRELGEGPPEDSYSGIVATDTGIVEFEDGERSSLVLENGSLRASYWGSIRLGCKSALVTCHTRSNPLSIGNSGRIDLRNTRTTLAASDPSNTPIGLEHDGHVLAEDAEIHLIGSNHSAIALQKASTLTCNDIYLDGEFPTALWATSGSLFVGRFQTDVGRLSARTGATICVEALAGKLVGPVEAESGGLVSLPDRVVGR